MRSLLFQISIHVAYWNKVSSVLNEDGNPRYCHLSKLPLTILLLPHGNVDRERGFSINKKILEKDGNNIDEDRLESVRTVKDFLIQSGNRSTERNDSAV